MASDVPAAPRLGPEHFARADERDDSEFYLPERMVHHLDEPARAALTGFYADRLPRDGRILDLMSSWVSHLPEDGVFGTVTGLGMNRAELDANPRLDDRVVHDLNTEPVLPFEAGAFDACLVALSIQYLTRPFEVFGEIARVLASGGVCAVAISNRCFPTKAVAIWRALDDAGHIGLVATYFRETGGFGEPEFADLSPGPRHDPLFVVSAVRA